MESKLLQGLTRNTEYTENGALTNSTTLNPVLDLFFKAGASRKLSDEQIISLLSKAYSIDKLLTMKLVFWAGDVRKGLGERRFFKICMDWIYNNHKEDFMKNFQYIPHFNRWDSLFGYTDDEILQFTYYALMNKDTKELAGKWMPREHVNNNKTASSFRDKFVNKYFSKGVTEPASIMKRYRKFIVGATNNSTIESKMCKKMWGAINYSHVPSVAFKKYRKAFKRNDESRFTEFLDKANKGEVKVNAGAIFPHNIIKEYFRGSFTGGNAINAQWKNLPDLMKDNNEKVLPVCDVSGSMHGEPIEVCIALGIYISERNTGIFKDSFITFSESPQLQTLFGGDVCSRIEQLQRSDWGFNTDLMKVFDVILHTAEKENIPQEEMPDKVLILSDMEFDQACERNSLSNFEAIDAKFREAGYERPQVVFWNLESRSTGNLPVQVGTAGTALISGFSPNILKSVLNGDLTPEKVMLKTLLDERYNMVTVG